jgi:hypothetical protein
VTGVEVVVVVGWVPSCGVLVSIGDVSAAVSDDEAEGWFVEETR